MLLKHFLLPPLFVKTNKLKEKCNVIVMDLCYLTLNDWSRGKLCILFPNNLNVSPDEVNQAKQQNNTKANLKNALTFQ